MEKVRKQFLSGFGMWYVIYCTSGKEEIVRLEIEKLVSSEIYDSIKIISSKRKRKFRGEWKEVEKRVFPGYLFVVTKEPEKLFTSLKKVPKFTKLLGVEDNFIPISRDEEELLEKLLGKTSPSSIDMSYGVIENDEVMVIDGPLKGLEGRISKIDRHKREAYLDVEFMGEIRQMRLGLEIIEKR